MAAHLNLKLEQIDIKGAYLNSELTPNEVIYRHQPPGYHAPNSGGQVAHLRKTLYGLKQSGHRWYQKLVDILTKLGYTRSDVDQAVFFCHIDKALTIIVVHVDDCTIASTSKELVIELKAKVCEHVEITDLGKLHWLLGIEVKHDREAISIHMSQHSYIDSILRRYNLKDSEPTSTPMDTQLHLSSSQSPSATQDYATMHDISYREAVGSLMYASLSTRPDILFAVTTLSHFSMNPGPIHWEAVKRVFRYLKGTKDLWLSFGGTRTELKGYADADGSMAKDRHTMSGYAFLLDGGTISWSSKHQEIILLSTTELEYVTATPAMKEAIWLQSLIGQPFSPLLKPTVLFPTISLPPCSLRITSTMPVPSTSTSVSTSYNGLSKTALFVWSTALPTTWLQTPSPRPSHPQRSNTLLPISDYVQFEGECWNTNWLISHY
jgi:hypothetical protein